eukprot:CAMPEP_0115493390 /NCGR_PEP_ID=MMETSP0271-20121206/64161_1 /TAXON_ID=71861 /ORGANISM="Scrippsiella trochoidea, Strain CCMP3099" /LENGTH=46 /DNA_ID= /DNA_START= /DNA_END= /DNA_ORIENTATION=
MGRWRGAQVRAAAAAEGAMRVAELRASTAKSAIAMDVTGRDETDKA